MAPPARSAERPAEAAREGGRGEEGGREGREGRGRRGRGRGRDRDRRGGRDEARAEAEARTPDLPPAAPRSSEALTLARAFDLMRRALAELPSPVGYEALRLRMAALHGREDTLLETERFARFLRQAHDAEVADVRKLGDGEFEVIGRGVEPAPQPAAAPAPRERAGAEESAAEEPLVVTPGGNGAAARGGIRFRRGSRLGSAPPAIAMVGVVSLDEEAPAEEPAEAAPKKGRGTKKKAAKAAPAEEAAEPAPAKKKASRPRAKKKAE